MRILIATTAAVVTLGAIPFLSAPSWAACPSYMVLTCRDQAAKDRKIVAPREDDTSKRYRILDKSGRTLNTVETNRIGDTTTIRVFEPDGRLKKQFRVEQTD